MKPLTVYLLPTILVLFAFSCDNNENLNNEKCAQAKLIQQWCPDPSNLAVINIISNISIGEDWTKDGKMYQNALLAQFDNSLLNSNKNLSELIGSSDSTFYFTYTTQTQDPLNMCYICCPPSKTILITSLSSTPCPITTEK